MEKENSIKIENLNDIAYFLSEMRTALKDLVSAVIAQQKIIDNLLLKNKK